MLLCLIHPSIGPVALLSLHPKKPLQRFCLLSLDKAWAFEEGLKIFVKLEQEDWQDRSKHSSFALLFHLYLLGGLLLSFWGSLGLLSVCMNMGLRKGWLYTCLLTWVVKRWVPSSYSLKSWLWLPRMGNMMPIFFHPNERAASGFKSRSQQPFAAAWCWFRGCDFLNAPGQCCHFTTRIISL